MYKINSHGHILPYPEDIPAFMKRDKLFWVDDSRQYMCQGDWKRPVTDPSFFLQEKLEWMDKNQIDHEVLMTLSQLYCNGLPEQVTGDVIRFQNDFHATVQAEHGDRFTCGFVVQPAFVDQALEEISRCVDMGLIVLCLPTHYQTIGGQWQSSAHADVDPIWALAQEHRLAVEIHPYDAPKMISLEDRFWRFHLIWMCAQTADHYHMFTSLDYPDRYPNVRTCYAHGNQYGQVNLGRRKQGYDGRPDLFVEAQDPRKSVGAKNVFFDTLVHDVDSLELLVRRHGVSQVVAGLDDPYPLGEMESVLGSYPGKVIDEGVSAGFLTDRDRGDIWNANVKRWLGTEINSGNIINH